MKFTKLLFILLSFSIAACSTDEKKLPEMAAPDKAEDKASKHEDRSPGKPSAPISLNYELLGEPKVGKQLQINVNLRGSGTGAKSTPVNAKVSYAKQLAGQSGTVSKLAFKADSKKSDSQSIVVTPSENGLFYVSIHASTVVDGKLMHKSFAIPVTVGNVDWAKQLQPEGQIKGDGAAGTVISFPAQE